MMNQTTANAQEKSRKPAKYPGYRTMTGAERRNARMHKIFDDAIARAKAEGKSSPWEQSTNAPKGTV